MSAYIPRHARDRDRVYLLIRLGFCFHRPYRALGTAGRMICHLIIPYLFNLLIIDLLHRAEGSAGMGLSC